jgi:hypothetical protein
LQHSSQNIRTTITRMSILEEVSDVAMKEIESDCIQSSEEDARESVSSRIAVRPITTIFC